MNKKRVYLALPRLGNPCIESCMAAFVLASRDLYDVVVDPRGSSLLAFGFNKSWCRFANDPSYDYFAMLHADHGPSVMGSLKHAKGSEDELEPPKKAWLDTLIEELEVGGYGVMHAPAAIKDGTGLTSTAIGWSKDPYSALRRITVKELQKLPLTFGFDEVKHLSDGMKADCLLPNTGVMVVKRDGFPLERFNGFNIRDRVVRYIDKGQDGKGKPQTLYCAEVEPEDWGFGRWCKRNGVKVGATRKVITNHIGSFSFTVNEPWGEWDHDQHWKLLKDNPLDRYPYVEN